MSAKRRVACILAAGIGSRLKSLTSGATKCMVTLNGHHLIDLLMSSLLEVGYDAYIIVVGYQKEALSKHVLGQYPDTPLKFIANDHFDTTNNIHSLYLAAETLANYEEVHLFESDVFMKKDTLVKYLTDPDSSDSVLVSPYEYWMDGTCVTVTPSGKVEAFISKRDVYRFGPNELFKTVNCYRFSAAFFRGAYLPFLRSYIEVCGKNSYYEEVLKVTMPVAANQLSAYEIPASDWMEIDDAEDLRRAEIVAETSPQEKARRLAAQFGGYWKTAGLQDLTLLENPFFPTPEFLSEFARQLPQALGMYPSTQSVICAVASKSSDFEPEQIVVGNGASELINILFQELEGNVNLVSPTFLEYQRAIGSRANIIQRTFPDTSYQSIVAESISNIKDHTVLVNPNNPTGEIVHRDTILKLASALRGQKKRLLIDESFIDFSDEQSCAQRELLRDFPNMLILRSFGKSYGVGGLRLGALFTADVAFAERLRARLPIWNISSFAEIFLDILPKYKTQYKESIERFKAERRLYLQKLQSVGLVVHQSAANFFLISLPDAIANRVCEGLLAQNLLVKRLERAGLRGTYIRIAIKDSRVNQKVVETLRAILRNN